MKLFQRNALRKNEIVAKKHHTNRLETYFTFVQPRASSPPPSPLGQVQRSGGVIPSWSRPSLAVNIMHKTVEAQSRIGYVVRVKNSHVLIVSLMKKKNTCTVSVLCDNKDTFSVQCLTTTFLFTVLVFRVLLH